MNSQVVDLGNLVIERFFEIAFRFNVALDRFKAFHALDISCNVLVLGEELVVCQPLDEVAQFEHVKVHES